MSYELNVKELNGDWDSIVAIRGKKGDTGTPGTIFTVDAHYVEGDDVVAIADFTTNNNGVVNTQTIYAPTSGGGGTQVTYTEGTQIADGTTVGTITVNGTAHAIKVPSKVSDLTNDSAFITEDDIPTVPTKTSDLTNDSNFVTTTLTNKILNDFAPNWSSGTYNVGDLVNYGGDIYRCKLHHQPGSLLSPITPANTRYWEQVDMETLFSLVDTKLLLLKQELSSKYMPGDVINARVVYGYAATSTSTFSFVLNKPIDASVTSATVTAAALRGGGASVSNPTLTAEIAENTDTAMPRQEIEIKYSGKPSANVACALTSVVITFA